VKITFTAADLWTLNQQTVCFVNCLITTSAISQTTSAIRAEDAAASPSKYFEGQNWLDLGKLGWIWAKFRRNLCRVYTNGFRDQERNQISKFRNSNFMPVISNRLSYPLHKLYININLFIARHWYTKILLYKLFVRYLVVKPVSVNAALDNVIRFGKIWLDFGKIKILHPQKHSIPKGYGNNNTSHITVTFFLFKR